MSTDHLDDDALSATLDDQATPDEAAHVETCANCRARVEVLREAAQRIGSPLPDSAIDPVRREALIAAALAAADDAPVSLAAHRQRRNIPAWLVGAAALVLLAILVVPGLVGGTGGDGTEETAAGGGTGVPEAANDPLTDSAAGEDAATMRATIAPVDAGDLGAVDDDALVAGVRDALAGPATESAAPAADSSAALSTMTPACEEELRTADPSLETLRVTGTATVEGTDARVLAFERAAEDRRELVVYAVSAADCVTVLARTALPLP